MAATIVLLVLLYKALKSDRIYLPLSAVICDVWSIKLANVLYHIGHDPSFFLLIDRCAQLHGYQGQSFKTQQGRARVFIIARIDARYIFEYNCLVSLVVYSCKLTHKSAATSRIFQVQKKTRRIWRVFFWN